MPEIWVTMSSCTECLRFHDDEGRPDPMCDCWCHDGDMDEYDSGDGEPGE